jgi:Domain of unknown function (DUF1937)
MEIARIVRNCGYWYLATPYSKWLAGIVDANAVAQKLAARLILERVPVYSPIAHTHGIALAGALDPFDHDIFMPADKPLFDASFGLLIADLPGWRESKGVQMEVGWARAGRKPMLLLNTITLDFSPVESARTVVEAAQ